MQNLNESLQAKYPHLELAILPLSQVNKDNESKRIDSEYFKKEYLENEERLLNLNSVKLGKICSFICNGDDCRDYKENGLKYIRTGDIKEYGLDLCNCATIRDDFISNIKLEIGDLLVTRKGNYGKSQVVNNIEILKSIVSSEIFQIKLKDINPYFVDVFLKTKFGQMQFEKNIHGVSNFSVTQESLLNFLIPLFSKPFQLEIEKLVKQSHEALEDSKRLYKEAQELLYKELELDFKNPLKSLLKSSLQADDYSLSLRGSETSAAIQSKNIDCHESRCDSRNDKTACHNEPSPCHTERSEVSKKSKCGYFANAQYDNMDSSLHKNDNIGCIATKYPHLNISVRPLSKSLHKSGRLDSEYYQSKYDLMENKIKDYKGRYCKLQPSEIKDSNFMPKAQEKYRYIELANIGNNGNISEPLEDFGENLPTRARRKVKTGDFIMSSIEGSLTSCALITPEFDNCVVSTGFYVLNSAQLNGETLLVLFKCEFFQEYLRKFPSGTILTAISKDELQNILIPKINPATQEQIALKIQKSFTLRAKSKDLLQNAKIKLENAIENG